MEQLLSTSISVMGLYFIRIKFNPVTFEGKKLMDYQSEKKKIENENTVRVGQFLGKATFKKVL